jgi:outer membrane protein TolC
MLTDEFKADVSAFATPQVAVEEALAGRPEVQAQFNRVKASEFTYSSITGERLPSLVAQGDFGWIGNRAKEAVETYSMAILLQIPIFDGGQREGRIAEARSNLRQEALRMRSVLNQVKMEVHDALAALAAAKEQVAIAQSGMQSATRELELAKERFAVITTASYFEITNGLTNLAKGKENLVNALFQLNSARVNLARSTGSLNSLN